MTIKSLLFTCGTLCSMLFSLVSCQSPNVDAPARSVNSIAFQNNALWLCRLERLDLSTNTFAKLDPKFYGCQHLFVAQNGWVWAYNEDMLQYYDGQTWHDPKVYTRDQGNLNAVTETRDGTIWVSSSILTRYDPRTGQATVIVPPQPTPTPVPEDQQGGDILGGIPMPTKGYVGPVFEAADGSLWFNIPFKGGIVQWNPGTGSKQIWGPNDGFDSLNSSPFQYLQSRDGSIWMGTAGGVHRFKDGQWQRMDSINRDGSHELGDFNVKDMLKDAQGRIWVVYKQIGVMMWDGAWREIGDFSNDQPLSLFEDSSGAIWIGFNDHGTVKYENGRLKSYPPHMSAFLETPDHRLFGGSRGEGLFLYNRASDQWEKYPPGQ
jgi:ligand-binding sensor domain-containing protein